MIFKPYFIPWWEGWWIVVGWIFDGDAVGYSTGGGGSSNCLWLVPGTIRLH